MTAKAWSHGDKGSRHKHGLGRQHQVNRAALRKAEPLCRLCKLKS